VLLKVENTAYKFYMAQGYEPEFYPAGSTFAQVEQTYRMGFYGLTNSVAIKELYEERYGGFAHLITPQIDSSVFHPPSLPPEPAPKRVFWYARPLQPRQGFELGAAALKRLKRQLGAGVEIVAAGENWLPAEFGLDGIVDNRGMLGYRHTADLYRSCHVGLSMNMTPHPSYVAQELMACGCVVVANESASKVWLLEQGETCLMAPATASAVAETLAHALSNEPERRRIRHNALERIAGLGCWNAELVKAHAFILNPPPASRRWAAAGLPR
jgi:glycosyltransferase involved in cell wall biosynthesis